MKYLFTTFCLLATQLCAGDISSSLEELGSNDSGIQTKARKELLRVFSDVSSPSSSKGELNDMFDSLYPLLDGDMSAASRSYLIRLVELFGDSESTDQLYPLLGDSDSIIRDSARRALAALSDEESNLKLMNGLMRASEEQRSSYMQALAYSGYAPAAAEIVKSLKSSNSGIQGSAAWALGMLGQSDTRSALFSALDQVAPENRLLVEVALLKIGLNMEAAQFLVDSSSQSSVRVGAFKQLMRLDAQTSEKSLKAVISDLEFPARVGILSAAMKSSFVNLHEILISSFETMVVADQILLVAAISDNRMSKYESFLIDLLSTKNKALLASVVDALGWVGGDASFPALYALVLDNGDDELIVDALSRLNAPIADEKLLMSVKKPVDSESAVAALRIMALRNSPGGTKLVNSIARESQDQKLLEASFSAIEKIGNLESAKILVDIILRDDPVKRSAQRSLKRFSLNFGVPELQWKTAYGPALANASSSQKESIIQVLDAAACQDSLDYLESSLADSALRGSVIRTLQRWNTHRVALVWVKLAEDEGATEKDISTAMKGLKRTFENDAVEGSFDDKVVAAAEAIQLSSSAQPKEVILAPFQKEIAPWHMGKFKEVFKPLINDSDIGDAIANIIK